MINLQNLLTNICDFLNPIKITPTFSRCSSGSATRCYRLGKLVILSFNINVTTATASYDYITNLPPALAGSWGCSGDSATTGISRWLITTNGTLRADGTPVTGWHNGNVIYVCDTTFL